MIGCVILHCNLQLGITQPIKIVFLDISVRRRIIGALAGLSGGHERERGEGSIGHVQGVPAKICSFLFY